MLAEPRQSVSALLCFHLDSLQIWIIWFANRTCRYIVSQRAELVEVLNKCFQATHSKALPVQFSVRFLELHMRHGARRTHSIDYIVSSLHITAAQQEISLKAECKTKADVERLAEVRVRSPCVWLVDCSLLQASSPPCFSVCFVFSFSLFFLSLGLSVSLSLYAFFVSFFFFFFVAGKTVRSGD